MWSEGLLELGTQRYGSYLICASWILFLSNQGCCIQDCIWDIEAGISYIVGIIKHE